MGCFLTEFFIEKILSEIVRIRSFLWAGVSFAPGKKDHKREKNDKSVQNAVGIRHGA